MNAYDYERQEWVSGEPARTLRITQIDEELAALQDPGYVRFMGIDDVSTYVGALEAERARLDNSVQVS